MNRQTYRDKDGRAWIVPGTENGVSPAERFATYEETDLTPEEIELMKWRNKEMTLYITCRHCMDKGKHENIVCPRCPTWKERESTELELMEKLGIELGTGTGEITELL